MVADEHDLAAPQNEWNEGLGLARLRALVHKHVLEAEHRQAGVTGTNTRCADNVGFGQDVLLHSSEKADVLLLVLGVELPELVAQLAELAETAPLGAPRGDLVHLVVQREELNRRRHALAALGTQTHYLQARQVNTLRQMVHGDVAGCRDEDLSLVDCAHVVHNRRARDGLAGARGALDEAQGLRQHATHGGALAGVELGKPWRGHLLGHVHSQRRRLHGVAEQTVVEMRGHTRLITREDSHGLLHAVVRRRAPHHLDSVAVRDLLGHDARVLNFDGDLVGGLLRRRDEDNDAGEGLVKELYVLDADLVTSDEPILAVDAGEHELPEKTVVVQPRHPLDRDVRLGLAGLHVLVVGRLKLNQRLEHSLIVICVLVEEEHGFELPFDVVRDEVVERAVGVRFPHVFQFVDLTLRHLADARRLALLRDLHEPRQYLPVFDQWQPRRGVPLRVAELIAVQTWLSAEQHHHRVGFTRDEPQHKNIFAPAHKALEDCVTQGPVGVEGDFLVLAADQVLDNMRPRRAAATVAEPLLAVRRVATHNCFWVVEPAVRARVLRQEVLHGLLFLFLFLVVIVVVIIVLCAGLRAVHLGVRGLREHRLGRLCVHSHKVLHYLRLAAAEVYVG
eukprot:PhM_4_TR14077/c6_g2_i1/m.60765